MHAIQRAVIAIIYDVLGGKVMKYVPPAFEKSEFHCPICSVYAHQKWAVPYIYFGRSLVPLEDMGISICSHCEKYAIWFSKKLIYPHTSMAPLPVEDMPEEVKQDYLEARDIVNSSPRAAAALLRLALQKLMIHLGEKGKNLNDDIASLVKKGLPERIQKALDAVRVIGNNAVHPGEIDLKDDRETAIALFELLNMIVEVMITQPKKVDQIYGKIPRGAKEAIEKRDKT